MTKQDAMFELWELESATNQKIDNFRNQGDRDAVILHEGYLKAILHIKEFLECLDD